jgi:uncharacterized protein
VSERWIERYQAPAWLLGGHAQTIWSAKAAWPGGPSSLPIGLAVPKWQRQRWETPDGDFIDVDTIPGHADQPQLTLFHGLEGSSASHYSLAFAASALDRGWTLAVPHFRSCSGEINRLARAYHSGDSEEAAWILTTMAALYPHHRRFAAGVSLGGNMLMKWAGIQGAATQSTVEAIAAIGAPLDLAAAGAAIGQGLNRWLYTPMFLRTMKRKAQAKWQQYPKLFDLDRVMRASSLAAFDDAFTAPLHGFQSVEDYWHRASAKPHLSHVRVRALLLHARNDPFVPWRSVSCAAMSAAIELWQPRDGGHVGFAQTTPHARWRGSLYPMAAGVMDWMINGGAFHG